MRVRLSCPEIDDTMSPIRLSLVARADAAELIAANLASQDHHRPWVHAFTDQAGFDSWFDRSLAGPCVRLVAREAASSGVVGIVSVNEIVAGAFQSGYLGYYGMARFAGRGLMTEAVRAAVRYAFDELGLHRLEANIQPDNVASIALARRVGFHREGFSPRYLHIGGEWRDHERWAILAD
jgi:ribosomal-protein-alanine N-acetyltransferase